MEDNIPEEIAARLTKAQRKQMLDEVVRWEGGFDLLWIGNAAVRCALQTKGLVEDRMYSQRLTMLGLAVRAHLLAQADGPTPELTTGDHHG